ncbi:thiopeptide-type bacteriocin biosynthesis protein [Kitasatospora sp. NBC_01560]|uniref:thiopeptide-type bacteriocin biosynthesis protein n=1 Tax=Kitasatospora sp. NBC_01560 TaxID=2975965 RepID=UPI00386C6636
MRGPVVGRDHGHLPGASGWAFAKVYGHPDRQAAILTRHLPELLADLGDGAGRVGAWADGLRRAGLVSGLQWDTYRPETGRYGTGAAMAAAEAVFAADSAAALAQLALTAAGAPHPHPHPHPHPQTVTAASFVDIAASFTGGTGAGARWLIDRIPKLPVPAANQHLTGETLRLTGPDGAALRSLPGGDRTAAAWAARCTALAAYRDHVAASALPTDAVLASLLHMHHIRMHGPDEDSERACQRLARAAALSWTARREGTRR